MLDNAKNVECLIFGSSHTYYGLMPSSFLPNTFNLAGVGQNYEYDYLLLKNYAPLYEKLHTIIIPVSFFSFFIDRFEESEAWLYAINYKKYMDIDIHSDISKYNFEISNLPLYSKQLMNILSNGELPECDSLGFGLGYTLSKRSTTWERDTHKAVTRHTAKNLDTFEWNVLQLCNMIDFCKENSIRIVLVTPPAWHLYYDAIDSVQLNKMYETVYTLQKEHDLLYYDFMRDCRFVKDDFYDSDHLSDVGAKKFTTILKTELTKLQ